MLTSESHISEGGGLEGEPEMTQGVAQKRLERASSINSVTPTSVSLWDLSKPSEGEKQKIMRVKVNKSPREAVKGRDDRWKVAREDLGPRGKYRFVCKLIGQYKQNDANDPVMELHGTGWLITKDLVVTAGHVIYDSEDKWGGLTSMEVFIGYNGKNHLHLESRYGKFVAAPTEWVKDLNRKYDLGFIKLSRPFKDVDPIRFMTTPESGRKEQVGVVGYPLDLGDGKYDGEYMYAHFLPTNWNLATAYRHMLEYFIDTSGGQSGAAVLLNPGGKSVVVPNSHRSQPCSIGVHVCGGEGREPNEASVIGTAGNVFEDFLLAIQVRNGSITSSRVKVSRSPGLNQLPNFRTFTVYPTGTTASRQLTPVVRSRKPSDERLSFNTGEWADQINGLPKKQLELLLQLATQRLENIDLTESTIGSADDERHKEQSDERSSSPRKGDSLFESPRKIEDESPDSSPACWIDFDES